jgi:hypothetical protein
MHECAQIGAQDYTPSPTDIRMKADEYSIYMIHTICKDLSGLSSGKDKYKRNVGPGTYRSEGLSPTATGGAGSSFRSANNRFMQGASASPTARSPGPADYSRDATQSTLLRRSYNITVGL